MKNKMNFVSNALLLMILFVFVSSCKDEDDVSKGGSTQSGIFTAQYNGAAWTAESIIKKTYPNITAVQFDGINKDNSALVLSFTRPPATGDSTLIPGGNGDFSHYPDKNSSTGMEQSMEGYLVIKNYSTDSLVARFEFKTASRNFTKGVIKIKIN